MQEIIARLRIAAMQRSVDERPKLARGFCCNGIAAEKPGTHAEKDTSALAKSVRLRTVPRETLERGKPRVLEHRQLASGNTARQKLMCNRSQAGLIRRTNALI